MTIDWRQNPFSHPVPPGLNIPGIDHMTTCGVEDRIALVRDFTAQQCQQALALPHLQRTVRLAVERRQRVLEKEAQAKERPVSPPTKREIWLVDVRDHMPDDEITVLVQCADQEFTLAWHGEDGWRECASATLLHGVTHWADLPEPMEGK